MPISPSRITTEYIEILDTENFLSLSDPNKVLESAANSADDSSLSSLFDAVGADSNGNVELLDPNGPLGKLAKAALGESSNISNILGLFDNIICKGDRYTFDFNLNLFLKNMNNDLGFNFNPTLCGYSLKNDPLGVLLKVASRFDPLGINININGDTRIVDKLKNSLNKIIGKSNIPDGIKKIISIKTDNKLPALRSPIGASIVLKKEFNDFISIGNKGKNVDYDWEPWLRYQNYQNTFDTIAEAMPHYFTKYVWDEWLRGTEDDRRAFVYSYSKTLLEENSKDIYNKLNTIKYVFDESRYKPTANDLGNFYSNTDKILTAMKTDKPTITKNKTYEWDKLAATFNDLIPKWNKGDNGYDFSKVRGNEVVNDLATAKTKSEPADLSNMDTGVITAALSETQQINLLNAFK
ncbi:MAG: hypothetical protein K2M73_07975 [Lachnospiraceae bacterium]|nr:hypothetical protein [Lachnospiraceae bacterium]